MLPSFCRSTVTVLRAPVSTPRGAPERDWTRPDRHVLTRCAVLGAATSESSAEVRPGVTVTAALYAQPGADVRVGDRIETEGGEVYEVVGAPVARESPTGACSHIKCELARYVG